MRDFLKEGERRLWKKHKIAEEKLSGISFANKIPGKVG